MRLEGRHGCVKATRQEEAAGEATAELKRESFSACSELTDQRRREEELLAAFAVARVLARRKLPHETFMEYKKALRRAGDSYVIPEPYYVVAFINGVGCEHLTHLLRESKPEDLDAAAKEAILLQRSDGAGPSATLRASAQSAGTIHNKAQGDWGWSRWRRSHMRNEDLDKTSRLQYEGGQGALAQQPTLRRTATTLAQESALVPSPPTTMIYPTAIFRTVIALSTVAATTQATVAGPRPSTQGSKRGKGTARYIDTAADLYETTVLNVASPNTYASAAANTKAGVNLRTITSPDAISGKFSYASPTNAAGAVTLIKQSDTMNTYIVQSPRTDKGVKNTKTYGTNVAGHTSAKKRGQQGGFGVGVGTILDVLNGYGATGQQGGYSKKNGAVHDSYGKNGASGGERSSYGKSEHGGKKAGKTNGNGAYSPLTGGNSIRVTPSTGGNPYVPAPPAPSTLNPTTVYGGNHEYGNGSKSTNTGGSREAPASSNGSGYGASGSGNPGQSSKSGSGSNKGGHGSNGSVKNSNSGSVGGSHAATEAPVPSSTGSGYGASGSGNPGQSSKSGSGSKKGGHENSNSGSVGGSHAATEAPVPSSTGSGYGASGSGNPGQSSKSGSGSNKGGHSPVPSAPAGYGSGSNDGKLNSSGNDNVGLGSTPTPAPTSAPTSSAPPPTVTPCTKSKSKQNGAKQSSNSYKQSGRN
ncbi:hypothetical protein PC128_g16110 [Phytophthora cactorum]|nr:hypothetical protein PC128_g16110 [Phytophthora cactorum]